MDEEKDGDKLPSAKENEENVSAHHIRLANAIHLLLKEKAFLVGANIGKYNLEFYILFAFLLIRHALRRGGNVPLRSVAVITVRTTPPMGKAIESVRALRKKL